MDLGLHGKVALVSNATTPVGAAIARALADEGAAVAVSGAEADVVAQVAAGLGAGFLAVPGVLSAAGGADAVVRQVLAHFGRLDIVVANETAELAGDIDAVGADAVSAVFQRAVLAPWGLARAVSAHMRARGSGRFVMVIGDAGKIPGAAVIGSSVVGAAQHAFVKSLSDDLGRSNVLVSGVSIGHIGPAPDGVSAGRDIYVSRSLEQQESGWAADVPLGRRGTPEDVANAVAFLCSDRSSFICGSNLDVDGGDQRLIF